MKKQLLILFLALGLFFTANAQYNGMLGFGVSPAGFPKTYANLNQFLQYVADSTCNGGVVYANGSWRDNLSTSGLIPSEQKYVCNNRPVPFNYTDMLTFAWASYPTLYLDAPSDATNNWTNASMKSLFLQALIHTADSLHPTYLFVGNEVNFYLTQDSLDYLNWAAFYSQAYDSIKKHSPTTKVGTVFNYEHMAGLGTTIGWTTPHWSALNLMDTAKMDVIGLTLYPFYGYDTAALVPATYLNPLLTHIGNKPFVITETGWPLNRFIGTWDCSATEQVNYVGKLFAMINGKNVEDVNWLFLNYLMDHSNTGDSIYCSVAMRDSLGNDQPALAAFLAECPTGLAEMAAAQQDVSVYPNPAKGEFYVKTPAHFNGRIEVHNITGEQVYTSTLRAGNNAFNLNLAQGLYLYRVVSGNKLIKQGKLAVTGE